jgi:anaerobic selenocysteine-containing dehydrogenase
MGFIMTPEPIICQLYAEELQTFRLAAHGHGTVAVPQEHRQRIATYFDPLPFWYPPFENDVNALEDYPLHAVTQRPMAMYHSWGSQNAWLRQIHTANRLYIPRPLAGKLGIADDDWVWVTSRTGRVKGQVKVMDGVNENTVWTWNAIGKRAGAWNLEPDAAESKKGFLLNSLIDELLPERESNYRYSNSDPITGQAAWYDLRVRVEKAPAGAEESEPQYPAFKIPPGIRARPQINRTGAAFRAARERLKKGGRS